jgi:hypothetical protein
MSGFGTDFARADGFILCFPQAGRLPGKNEPNKAPIFHLFLCGGGFVSSYPRKVLA